MSTTLIVTLIAVALIVTAIAMFSQANKRALKHASTAPITDLPNDTVQPFTDISDSQAQTFIAETMGAVILDVRTPEEWREGIIEGAVMIPVQVIEGREGEVPPGPLLVVCKAGARSAAAADYLASCGRTDIYNLDCGMMGWTGTTVTP